MVDGAGGSVDVLNRNGSVEVTGITWKGGGVQQCANVTLKTSFAPIRIYLPEAAGFSVTAKTSFGKVASDFPLTAAGAISSESISGKIGSGECQMVLTDNNGNIEILRAAKKP
jgi:hypothetical protein